ncbi:MAG: hypothetical protein ABL903_07475 [Methylococcales bacterium]
MAKETEKKTLKLVHSANKPENPNTKSRHKSGGNGSDGGGSGGDGGDTDAPEITESFGEYCIINGVLNHIYVKKSGEDAPYPLCDFVAWINKEINVSNGETTESFLVIEGKRHDGLKLPAKEVSTTTFYSGNTCFNDLWGAKVIVEAGATMREHLRVAIHKLSTFRSGGTIPVENQHAYTGWQVQVTDGQYRFLTSSGALGQNDLDESVKVKLKGDATNYYLPLPDDSDNRHAELSKALLHCLSLLTIAPNKLEIGALALCAIFRAPLSSVHKIDFGLIFYGRSGSYKSELAAAMLAFFGTFTRITIPLNWSSTDNALEQRLYTAADLISVIDDFLASVNINETNKQYAKFERIGRSIGNQAGRDRMNQESTYYPRGMVISTNEVLPKGGSLLGRFITVTFKRGDITREAITNLQAVARAGHPKMLMAAYIQWLAPQMPTLKQTIPEKVRQLREEASDGQYAISHPRAAEIYANLMVGLDMFLSFCETEKLLNTNRTTIMQHETADHIKALLKAQSDFQDEQDEPLRFISLLISLLSSGSAHIADNFKNNAPIKTPFMYGWRTDGTVNTLDPPYDYQAAKDGESYGITQTVIYKPYGKTIGWVNQAKDEIYLDMETAFKEVQIFANQQNAPLLTPKADIIKQLGERGYLIASEPNTRSGTIRYDVKRHAGKPGNRVIVIKAALIRGEDFDPENLPK